jgi:hypothetical protein
MKNIFNLKKNKGFALLFSVIVSVVLLAIGLSIISVSLKQLVFAGTGRESQIAFYAANTGIECALYWNFTRDPDNSSVDAPDTIFAFDDYDGASSGSSGINCARNNITNNGWYVENNPPAIAESFFDPNFNNTITQTRFWIYYPDENGIVPTAPQDRNKYPCVDVRVKKQFIEENSELRTKIEARGYNTCNLENKRTVERGLEVYL